MLSLLSYIIQSGNKLCAKTGTNVALEAFKQRYINGNRRLLAVRLLSRRLAAVVGGKMLWWQTVLVGLIHALPLVLVVVGEPFYQRRDHLDQAKYLKISNENLVKDRTDAEVSACFLNGQCGVRFDLLNSQT